MIENPSEWDNRRTDDPDEWEAEADDRADNDPRDLCPWCGSAVCGDRNQDGRLECRVTKRLIP